MTGIVAGFIGAGITALAGLLVVGSVAFIKRRIKVTGPNTEAVESLKATVADMAPAVNALLAVQKPQLGALIALLEVTKGQCNGNVDKALETTRDAEASFDAFLSDAAKVKV